MVGSIATESVRARREVGREKGKGTDVARKEGERWGAWLGR